MKKLKKLLFCIIDVIMAVSTTACTPTSNDDLGNKTINLSGKKAVASTKVTPVESDGYVLLQRSLGEEEV